MRRHLSMKFGGMLAHLFAPLNLLVIVITKAAPAFVYFYCLKTVKHCYLFFFCKLNNLDIL